MIKSKLKGLVRGGGVGGWLKNRVPLLSGDKPLISVLMYPAAEQNPFLLVTRNRLEDFGAKVTMLNDLDPASLSRLAPSHDILHIFNIKEYKSPFGSSEMIRQVSDFSTRIASFTLAKTLGLKIFWTLYNDPKGDYTSERLEKVGRRWIFRMTDRIICPSQSTRQELSKRYSDLPDHKLTILPHHNFDGYFPKQVTRREALRHLGIEAKGRVFLCFGGIHPYKGLTDIIPLFGKHPLNDHTLIVAGNPSNIHYAQTIEGLASRYDNVHVFLRYVANDEVQYYLQASDLFVMPYKDVLNSGSMMLALSFGKPLVAPAVGSIPEVINPSCAILFEQAGSNKLKAALTRAIDVDLDKASEEARRVSMQYSADVLTRRLINSYLDFFPRRPKLPEEEEEEL